MDLGGGTWAHPPALMGVGLLCLVQPKNKKGHVIGELCERVSAAQAAQPGHDLRSSLIYNHVLNRGPDGTPMVKRVASLSGDGIWVEGDNEPVSRDSRRFGRISDRAVRGRVVWRYWPLGRAGRVR